MKWTQAELDYLEESWGKASMWYISKKIKRSINAIKIKASKLGLDSFLLSGDYITFNQLYIGLFGHTVSDYILDSWVKKRGMPVRYIRPINKKIRIISLQAFWDWAEKHKTFIEWDKTEINCLGKEPAWVERQRRLKTKARNMQIKKSGTKWTDFDDARLKHLVKNGDTYQQIAKKLNRTEGAIVRRISTIGIKILPVRIAPHESKWLENEKVLAKDMILSGIPYCTIAESVHKSEKAVRGKAYIWFGTESQDTIMNMPRERQAL